jgi:hypothetical protein
MLLECKEDFAQERTWTRARELMIGGLASLSRRTITGLITAAGRQFDDWTADYRLFSRERIPCDALFGVVRRDVVDRLGKDRPLVVAMDDTSSHKRGKKIPGTGWRRDPLGPHFRTQFVWGRRFIQLSAALPAEAQDAPGRAIPIAVHHAPSAKKPRRKAPPEAWATYKQDRPKQTLSRQGIDAICKLRNQLDDEGERARSLWMLGDGSYTNRPVLTTLPARTTFIGRVRADACFHSLPEEHAAKGPGRRRQYGARLPTPEEIRQDDALPWATCPIYAAGKVHTMRYKTIGPILWRNAGASRPLRLVVIAPLGYRNSAHSTLLYRRPAYLICTDPSLTAEEILKAYVSRWDIEVNFRDEKSLIGFDQAQVRTDSASTLAPAFAVASYAMLLLAAVHAYGLNGCPETLPPPKWRRNKPRHRPTTVDLLNQLRHELFGAAISTDHFSPLPTTRPDVGTPEKLTSAVASVLFYAQPAA